MSEYRFVEEPFLTQLEALGWEVIDQGEGIPRDPSVSHRSEFREVVLKDVFKQSINKIEYVGSNPHNILKQLTFLLQLEIE